MNLPKRSSFKSVLKVYTLSKILLWIKSSYFCLDNACYSFCTYQIGLFSKASVVPQSKFTGELWSSASVVPQSKSTGLCSSAAAIPQSKSNEMWSSTGQTNILARQVKKSDRINLDRQSAGQSVWVGSTRIDLDQIKKLKKKKIGLGSTRIIKRRITSVGVTYLSPAILLSSHDLVDA